MEWYEGVLVVVYLEMVMVLKSYFIMIRLLGMCYDKELFIIFDEYLGYGYFGL